MRNFTKAGNWFFAICLTGLAGQQFYYGDFRPVFVPELPAPMPGRIVLVYLFSLTLMLSALSLVTGKKTRTAMLLLGCLFLALVLFYHIPYHLLYDPHAAEAGVWNNALKELAFSGSAFILAGSFPEHENASRRELAISRPLENLIPFGTVFFSIMMIVFGVEHFLYAEFVKTLVPDWIPAHLFWTYFAAVALIGAGLAIMVRFQLKLVAMLLGTMIFTWFLILHIPRAVVAPVTDKGNELTSVFESLGFSGVALVIACICPVPSRQTVLA